MILRKGEFSMKLCKKNMALILILTLTVFIIGCGNTQNSLTTSDNGNTDDNGGAIEDQSEFFKGKMITIIVPYSAGGGFDTMARIAGRYVQKYIPGSTVIVQNVPGAGSIIGVNQLFQSNPDGLTLGVVNGTGAIIAELIGEEGIQFDLSEFSYLGRLVIEHKLIQGSALADFRSMDDVINSEKEVTISTTGPGSGDHQALSIIMKALNVKHKFITGYSGFAEARMATVRNEANITQGALSGSIPLVESGDVIPLAVVSSFIPDSLSNYNVPKVSDLAKSPEQEKALVTLTQLFELERMFAAPPGLQSQRLEFLQKVFEQIAQDSDFIIESEQANLDVHYASAQDIESIIRDINNEMEAIKPYLDVNN
jgi:tripartite-type tricarboxylate transporter receptor subunit TctC